MQNGKVHLLFRLQKTGLSIALALVMVTASLLVLQLDVFARFSSSGEGGCGNFIDAVGVVSDTDTIIQMLAPRDSGGAVISKNITIQGGWSPPSGNCSTPNQTLTDTTDFLAAGFTFNAPLTRSTLTHAAAPVLTIDANVKALTIEHMILQNTGGATTMGGGISGVISNGATVLLDNVVLTGSTTTDKGGGLFLEVRGGSRLVIKDSQIVNNSSQSGGGVEVHVYDNSTVEILNSKFTNNSASIGNGGGARIQIISGTVVVADSTFTNNKANMGKGGGLAIESTGNGTAILRNNTFNTNTATSDNDLYTSGQLLILQNHIFLPIILRSSGLSVMISNISLSGNAYNVTFQTTGFTPQVGKEHIHFFFNTVPASQAGMPGSGPWKVHESTAPFTGYMTSDKPAGATQMCALVANADHSVQQGTGNCVNLP